MSEKTKEILINGRPVGADHPAYIIAEMSANHAGSPARAKEIIHRAKEAGADCIKIQTYTPDTITIDCDSEYFRIDDGTWKGETLYGLYGKAYTPWEWQGELFDEAKKVGIDFLSTPFDPTSVDFLEGIGLSFYKVASFEITDLPLIRYIASKKKPVILSTGMATLEEISDAVNTVFETGNRDLILLKCKSAYPADPKDMNLRTIRDLSERFGIPVGLSDHSPGSFSARTAVAAGASVIEKHFCLGREIENPDASFSMTPEEFADMVKDVRETEAALGKVFYGPSPDEEYNLRFRRSLFAVRKIGKGEPLTPENVRSIRPSNGLSPKYLDRILGKVAAKDIPFGTPLSMDLIEGMEE
ncbi:MAG: pseudaminic acid synthase [Lachnospiraceae bacterium]|nr:pseudaminic acid synthase [Lachnospiraceae bacterium]